MKKIALLFTLIALFLTSAEAQTLWYDRPADFFEEALVIDYAALHFREVAGERSEISAVLHVVKIDIVDAVFVDELIVKFVYLLNLIWEWRM